MCFLYKKYLISEGIFDCLILHDVDMLPEDDRGIYSCEKSPAHFSKYVDKWNYEVSSLDLIMIYIK